MMAGQILAFCNSGALLIVTHERSGSCDNSIWELLFALDEFKALQYTPG